MFLEKCAPSFRSRINLRDIAVNQLHKGKMAIFGVHVESLGFDARGFRSNPFLVLLRENGIGCCLGLLGDGMNGIRAIDRLGGTSHRCNSVSGGQRRSAAEMDMEDR